MRPRVGRLAAPWGRERGRSRWNANVPEPAARPGERTPTRGRERARNGPQHFLALVVAMLTDELTFAFTGSCPLRVGVRRARARGRSGVCVRVNGLRGTTHAANFNRSKPLRR